MSSQAAQELQAFVRRIESVEDEINALNADKSEIYKEAKANGYTPKTIRKVVAARRVDASEREEADAEFELYWNAVHGIDPDLVRAHVENIEEFDAEVVVSDTIDRDGTRLKVTVDSRIAAILSGGDEVPAHDAETGEITEQQDAPHPASDLTASPELPQGQVALHTPETANDVPGSLPVPAAEPQGGVNWTRTEIETSGDSAERRATSFQKSHRAETPKGLGLSAPCDVADSQDEVAGAPASAAPARFDARRLRPNCQRPFECGGQGREHCFRCRKAMAEGESA